MSAVSATASAPTVVTVLLRRSSVAGEEFAEATVVRGEERQLVGYASEWRDGVEAVEAVESTVFSFAQFLGIPVEVVHVDEEASS